MAVDRPSLDDLGQHDGPQGVDLRPDSEEMGLADGQTGGQHLDQVPALAARQRAVQVPGSTVAAHRHQLIDEDIEVPGLVVGQAKSGVLLDEVAIGPFELRVELDGTVQEDRAAGAAAPHQADRTAGWSAMLGSSASGESTGTTSPSRRTTYGVSGQAASEWTASTSPAGTEAIRSTSSTQSR